MRIRTILIIGTSVVLASAGVPALASEGAGASAALALMGKGYSGGNWGGGKPGMGGGGWHGGGKPGAWHGRSHASGNIHRWGPRQNGRWYAGWRAPGGWNSYRRPIRGYVLPSYWISPNFAISNYGAYGLPAPAYGYGWSRYYDDAVMADRYGRVYDYRSDVDWGRYDGGYEDDGYDRDDDYRRQDSGVGGATVGAVVGGIAGNRIAGHGNRTAGTLIGAGVGAVAGYAIDKTEDGPHPSPPPRGPGSDFDHDYSYGDDTVTYGGNYGGRWVGTWYGKDGTTYSGEYEGDYQGTARGSYGVDYDAPPLPREGYRPQSGPAPLSYGGGYVAGGFYYPAPTMTTVTIQPAVTTTTTYVTEQVSYRRPVARKRVRRACACK